MKSEELGTFVVYIVEMCVLCIEDVIFKVRRAIASMRLLSTWTLKHYTPQAMITMENLIHLT